MSECECRRVNSVFEKFSASTSSRRLSARGWGQDTARCAGDITIVACKKKEHTLLCALSFWNRHRHTLPGPRRFRLIRRRRTSLAAPADTARAPFPLALWRAIASSLVALLLSTRRLSARGWGQDTARSVQKERAHIAVCSSFWNRHRHTLPGQPSTICADELNFCVRYENRWDLIAIDTGIVERSTGGARLHIHNCIAESLLCITGFRLVVKLYLIEALGLLVSVSSTHYCAYTPDLSTLWSTRGLTQIALLGYLILRLVSRLDAFSVYPIRTSLPCCATGVTTDAP